MVDLKRLVKYREDGSVIFQTHTISIIENMGSCSCGFSGTLEDFEYYDGCIGGCTGQGKAFYYCPVVEVEASDQMAYQKAREEAAGALCAICGRNWVDVMEGFDTCSTCQPRASGRV